jgi:hypothetical protein
VCLSKQVYVQLTIEDKGFCKICPFTINYESVKFIAYALVVRSHDTQYNDIQNNDTQHDNK